MGLFRRKNKSIIEEQNKAKSYEGDVDFMDIAREAQQLRSTNMSEEDVQNWLINQLPEGRIRIDDKRMWICRSCENARKFDTKEDYIAHRMSAHGLNDKFALKQLDFNDGLESVIEISYGAPRESKVKLFFSKGDFATFSRNYAEKIKDNFVRLTIQPATRANASLISGGNFDFNDSFDKGYTLSVSFRRADSKLLAVISQILRNEGFGCLPSKFSIIAHQNTSIYPTDVEAAELLTKLNYKIAPAILEMK